MRMRLAAAAGALALAMAFSTPAFAQYVGGTPPSAGSTSNPGGGTGSESHNSHNQSTPSVRVSSGPATPQSSGFALTGADILQLVVLAGACTIGGVVLVRGSRRRTGLA